MVPTLLYRYGTFSSSLLIAANQMGFKGNQLLKNKSMDLPEHSWARPPPQSSQEPPAPPPPPCASQCDPRAKEKTM